MGCVINRRRIHQRSVCPAMTNTHAPVLARPRRRVTAVAVGMAVVLLLSTVVHVHGKRRSAKEWAEIEAKRMKEIEEQLKEGDEQDELRTEDQEEFDRMEARKNNPTEFMPSNFDMSDPSSWMSHSKSSTGPTMIFAKLNTTMPDGKTLQKKDTEEMGAMWRE